MSWYERYGRRIEDSRPDLDACLKALRQGDTLAVWKLDRLGATCATSWVSCRN